MHKTRDVVESLKKLMECDKKTPIPEPVVVGVDTGSGESETVGAEFVVKGSKAYLNTVHVAQTVLFVDYKGLEERLAASMMDSLDCKLYDEIHKSAYRSGKPSTSFYEIARFCELYGVTVDNFGEIVNGDDAFLNGQLKKHYPELQDWYNRIFQKPCGEIPLGEPVKCLPPPTKEKIAEIAANIEGVRTGRSSSTKENKSNDPKRV